MNPKQIISRIPIPFCGVALAIAALGLVLEQWSSWAWTLCGVVSSIMICLFIARIVLFPRAVMTDLDNPVLAGVAGTFPMALLNLSTYLARLSWHAGFTLWLVSVVIFAALIVRFSVKFARKAKVNDLTPAYFVIYIGAMAASTTAPTFGMQFPGLVLTWVGFAATVVLVVLVTLRIIRSALPQPLMPLLCIYAAPPSMCLAAYLSCAAVPSDALVSALYVLSCAFYLMGLAMLIVCLRLPFYPTYAAMTFPFVIAAAASTKLAALMQGIAPLEFAVAAQTAIASIAVTYVFVRYLMFLLKP